MTQIFNSVAIMFTVGDIDRTEAFYRDHLGVRFTRNTEEDGLEWLLAKLGGSTELIVFLGEPKVGNTPVIVFGLEHGGIDAAVASLAAAGVEIVTPVSHAPGGWSAEFLDPDGQPVAFFQTSGLPR